VFDAKTFVAGLPNLPGVYRMLGASGEALYVGKAKDLRRRVGSYFGRGAASPRIAMMLTQVGAIEVTATRSEDEALLLENNLIKSLAPRYNILFRDDKSYPYLLLSGHRYPRLGFHRGAKDRLHRYYGPFPHAHAVRESIQLLQRIFQLRTCEDSVFENRSRPCLLHQIRRCTAPCVELISAERYAQDVRGATLFLEGREDDVLELLNERMAAAAAARHYEEAAIHRDQIRALTRVQARQYVESRRGIDADVIGCALAAGSACVNLTMIRGGRHVGDRSFFPANVESAAPQEIVAAFVAQHYVEQRPPALVLVAEKIDAALAGAEIVMPLQGERAVWLEMARRNAALALARRGQERGAQEARLNALRERLALPAQAQRIECFDISHTMGEATVASCVVYDRHGLQRGEYRRFNIRDVAPGDDYAAMRQALARRYGRVAAGEGRVPDLILIDGGRGQVAAAQAALAELGLSDVAVVGVAKGPARRPGHETLLLDSGQQPLRLPPEHAALHLIQQVRDEAHRFAIVGHRARRGRARMASALSEIPGIGAKRRQRLLAHFGGLRGVQAAAVEELAKVGGMGQALARKIYRHLHG
jgi:excinuclease ABC subunit C